MKTILATGLCILLSFHSFGDDVTLTRKEAQTRALQDNPSVQSAHSRMQQAEAQWRQLRGQNLPGIFLGGSGTWTEPSDRSLEAAPGLEASSEQFAATVEASWLLFNGGTRKYTIEAARDRLSASQALEAQTRLLLLAAVGQGYHAAQLARVSIRIAESDLAFNQQQVDDASKRHKAGQGAYADILNFEIRSNTAASDLEQAHSNYDSTRAALEALLAHDGPDRIAPEELTLPEAVPEVPEIDRSWKHAQTNLPSLVAQRSLVDSSQRQLQSVRGNYWPELRLVGNVNAARPEDPAFGGEDVGSSAGITLGYNFYDGGARRNRVREAEAVAQEQQLALEQLQLDAKAEVQSSISNLNAAIKKLALTKRNLELTTENRELIEKAYRAGRESLIRLNEAQRDFVNAQSRLALSAIQVETAQIRVLQATGDLLPQ